MRTSPILVVLALTVFAAPAAAQTEPPFREAFEGKRVTLKIDMPGTAAGVDIRPGTTKVFDEKQYSDRLRQNGIAIHGGDTAVITLVRLKKDLIEVQLDGGGFGTLGDDSSTSVNMPLVYKSNREQDLEKLVRSETDSTKKRALQRELDDLRNSRERENRRITATKSLLDQQKRKQVAEDRLRGGSRFNLRFPDRVPEGFRPPDVIGLLAEYIDFSGRTSTQPSAPLSGTGLPRKGMLRADAERELGRPAETSERREGTLRVVTLVFIRGEQRITTEFIEDVLVRYTISSK